VREECAVREARDGIVKRLMGELFLEGLPFADVAAVQNDAANVLVVPEVGVLHLELQRRSVAMVDRALEGVSLRADRSIARDQLSEPGPVGFAEDFFEPGPENLVGAVAEDALDGRALVGDDALAVEDGDQVARMRNQAPETGFASPTVEVRGEGCALEGKRDLGAQRLERVDEGRLDR